MSDLDQAYQQTVEAFNPDNYYFYNAKILTGEPWRYNNFIDGLAWIGLLCGACYKSGSYQALKLAKICEEYIRNILNVGPDARTYAPVPVTDEWIKSETIPNMWYKKKPQSFAGPAGLRFAIDCGAPLTTPFRVMWRAKIYVFLGGLFGHALNWPLIGKWLRQHVNSVMLAHLITGSKVPDSMMWLTEENPFFGYIAGKKMDVVLPPMRRYKKGHTEERDSVVPLAKRKPSIWIWRNWPKSEYVVDDPELSDRTYIPVAYLVAKYLQDSME